MKKGNGLKNLAFWLFLILLLYFFFKTQSINPQIKERNIIYSEFKKMVEKGEIKNVEINEIEKKIIATSISGNKYICLIPYNDPNLISFLEKNNIEISGQSTSGRSFWFDLFISWGPMIGFILFLWFVFYRQIYSGSKGAFSFSKSKAKMLQADQKRVTFADVAGCEEAKKELEEIIEFLKDPKKFQKLGGKIPKGVLVIGPPGTGKTLLAKAVAGEANRPFFSISGSDFVEMFVGVGASRVRDLFNQSKKHAPCIVFIDEIDAVGRMRGAGIGGGHDEREQTLNQLLVEMDGFDSNEGIIIIAATNRPDVLDPALLRPGRFDRQVVVDIPDIKGRIGVLKVHTRNIPLESTVDLEEIARGTPGFTGADLANLVNEAALLAARHNLEMVTQEMLDLAKDKVMMGPERKSMVINEKEKKVIAYHEVGHALVAEMTPGTDPLHKITIIPRGRALGVTMQLPKEDKYTLKKSYLLAQIAVLLGGTVAEEIIFEDISNGAANDIERATNIARKMVCEWGMSEKLGKLTFGKKEESIFLGRELAYHKDYSEKTAQEIDAEIKGIVTEQYNKVKEILNNNKELLIKISEVLIEKETMTGEELKALIRGEEIEIFKRKKAKSTDKIQVARTFFDDKIIFTFSDGLFSENEYKLLDEAFTPINKIGAYIKRLYNEYQKMKDEFIKNEIPTERKIIEQEEKEIFKSIKDKLEEQIKERKIDITIPEFKMLEEKKTPNFRIEIHGFTDSIGEPRENLILSEKRANFVKNIFIENYNLPKEIIVTFGKADAEPIASNYIAEGRRKNRRVKIIVIVDNLKELDYEEIWRDVITEFMNKNNEVENEDKKEEEQKKENEQSKN